MPRRCDNIKMWQSLICACRPVMLYICSKFCEIIWNDIKVIEWTWFLYWKLQRGILQKDTISILTTELLLGIFKKEPTPPFCSEKGATVFCHRAIQWFHRNCLIFLIWKINQTKLWQTNDYYDRLFENDIWFSSIYGCSCQSRFQKANICYSQGKQLAQNKQTVSCLAKTQPQPFLSNGILMILCVNMPTYCDYSMIRHALHLFCASWPNSPLSDFAETAISHCIFRLDRHVGTSFSKG